MKAIREIIAEHKAGRAVGHLFRLLRASAGDRGGARSRPARVRLRVDRGHLQSGQSGRRLHGHAPGGFQPLRARHRGAARRAARAGAAGRRSSGPELLAGSARGGGHGEVRAAHRGLCRRRLSQDSSRLFHVLRGRSGAAHRRDRGGESGAAVRRRRAGLAARRRRSAGVRRRHGSAGPRRRPGGAHRAGVDRSHGRHRNHRRALRGVSFRGSANTSGRA